MIILKITMNVILEKQKELVQTLLSMMDPTEKASGCLGCTLYCDMEDKNLLMFLGEWQTRKDLDHHLGSDIFSVLLGTKSLLHEPHVIQIYTIHQTEGMETTHASLRNKPKQAKTTIE